MTPYELYQWALEQGLENEQLYVEAKDGERPVEINYLEVMGYGIVL